MLQWRSWSINIEVRSNVLVILVIHPGNTKVMIVSKRKISKFIGPIQNVTMSGRDLEVVESQKVLGVTIYNLLVWKTHLEIVLKHFRTKIKMLKRMNALGREVINKFYYSTIIPSVTYNITVWGNNNTIIKQLDILHAKAAAKLIYRLDSNMTDEDSIKKAGWMSMEYMYKRRLLCLMHKIYFKNIDPEILNMFCAPE